MVAETEADWGSLVMPGHLRPSKFPRSRSPVKSTRQISLNSTVTDDDYITPCTRPKLI